MKIKNERKLLIEFDEDEAVALLDNIIKLTREKNLFDYPVLLEIHNFMVKQ